LLGVITTCLVTLTLDALTVLDGVPIPVGVELLTNVPFPNIGGNVEIDLEPLLGVDETLIVPCPSVDFETQVALSPIITANLTVQVAEA